MSWRFILSRAGPELKFFSRAGRAISLGHASPDIFLSRVGRGGFFFSRTALHLPSVGGASLELLI